MEAGRKLDALIAEHVMGWGPIKIDRNGNPVGLNPSFPDRPPIHIVDNYSTSIQSAMKVFEKLRNGGKFCCLTIKSDYNFLYDVLLTKASYDENDEHKPSFIASDESLPLAICKVALKAVGYTE